MIVLDLRYAVASKAMSGLSGFFLSWLTRTLLIEQFNSVTIFLRFSHYLTMWLMLL